jgi:hypothetical protein
MQMKQHYIQNPEKYDDSNANLPFYGTPQDAVCNQFPACQ